MMNPMDFRNAANTLPLQSMYHVNDHEDDTRAMLCHLHIRNYTELEGNGKQCPHRVQFNQAVHEQRWVYVQGATPCQCNNSYSRMAGCTLRDDIIGHGQQYNQSSKRVTQFSVMFLQLQASKNNARQLSAHAVAVSGTLHKKSNRVLSSQADAASHCSGAACTPEQPDALPEGLQHIIKGLNAVRSSGFGQGSYGQRCDGLHLLVLVSQTMLDDVHQGLQSTSPLSYSKL